MNRAGKQIKWIGIMSFLIISLFAIKPQLALAASDDDTSVSTVEELNVALGGNHKVEGNTLILQSDVELHNCIILGDNYDIKLDMNGKTIRRVIDENTKKNEKYIFKGITGYKYTKAPSFKIVGDGAMTSTDSDVRSFYLMGVSKLEIAGNIDEECGIYMHAVYTKKYVNASLIIRDGVFTGNYYFDIPKAVICGGKFDVDIKYYTELEWCSLTTSKIIVKGGELKGISAMANIYVKGGVINGDVYSDYKIVVSGGTINGSVSSDKGGFTMTGGVIRSNGDVAVSVNGYECADDHLHFPTARLQGGKIIVEKENGIGLSATGVKVVLSGGQIIQKSGNGKYGIYVDNTKFYELKQEYEKWLKTNNDKNYLEYLANRLNEINKISVGVYWKGISGESLHVKGFTKSFAAKSTKQTILKNTKISTPNAKKAKYRYKDTAPGYIKGNLKLTAY